MSAAEPLPQFLDTNVLVYAFDHAAGEKSALARRRVVDLWQRGNGGVSIQVLQEFFVTVTARITKPLSPSQAAREITDLSRWRVHRPTPGDVLSAIDLHERLRISFWDAMIVHSARSLGCEILWTEDLGHGQTYAGVTARNPFA